MKINDVVTLMELGYGPPGSRAMGTGNFALLHRAYVNKRPKLSRNLQLDFGNNQVIELDDADIEAVWSQEHSLSDFLDARHFKSYDELKKKLEQVLNATGASTARAESVDLDKPRATPVATSGADRVQARAAAKPAVDEDDDESLSYFAKLAADD